MDWRALINGRVRDFHQNTITVFILIALQKGKHAAVGAQPSAHPTIATQHCRYYNMFCRSYMTQKKDTVTVLANGKLPGQLHINSCT